MIRGRVVFLRPDKRSGYIRLPDTREEFFFKIPANQKVAIQAGDWVSFRLVENRRGIEASEVKKILIA